MVSEFARAIHIDIHIYMAVSDWMFDSSVQSVQSVDGLFATTGRGIKKK